MLAVGMEEGLEVWGYCALDFVAFGYNTVVTGARTAVVSTCSGLVLYICCEHEYGSEQKMAVLTLKSQTSFFRLFGFGSRRLLDCTCYGLCSNLLLSVQSTKPQAVWSVFNQLGW